MKPIVLTQEAKDNALEIFKNLLNNLDANADLKINITTDTLLLQQGVEKPTIYVLASAYVKMMSLIKSSNKELAWYGVATRVNNNYFIEDILVYPQSVTTATVDADEAKCAKWFMELPDEVINNLKFQGHSHVGMTASPSGRDTNNWQQFANLLKPEEFMILCIGNNKGDFYWNIYDKAINIFFENKDITMVVVDDKGNSIDTWAKESINKYIIEEKPNYTASYVTSSTSGVRAGFVTKSYNNTQIQIPDHSSHIAEDDGPKPRTKSENSTYDKMIKFIPANLKEDVDYDVESDVYFTYIANQPGFYYSSLYACYICQGDRFRRIHPMQEKRPVGRPKKDKKDK